MEQQDYIKTKMAEFAMNIDEFEIDETVLDLDKSNCVITDKTNNSIEVFIKAKTNKGIDCKQWFDMREFNKRFSKI